VDVSRVRFILPALPTLRCSPPTGEGWQIGLKFNGYRVQLHKVDQMAAILVGTGRLHAGFPTIAAAVAALPVKSSIVDGS